MDVEAFSENVEDAEAIPGLPVSSGKIYLQYKTTQSIALGGVRIGLASLIITLISAYAGLHDSPMWGWYSTGYVAATLIIKSGSWGISAGKKRTQCTVVTHEVMSIISAGFAAPTLITVGVILISSPSSWWINNQSLLRSLGGIIIGLAITLLILEIYSSTLSCRVICCTGKVGDMTTLQLQGVVTSQGFVPKQVIHIPTVATLPAPAGGAVPLAYTLGK